MTLVLAFQLLKVGCDDCVYTVCVYTVCWTHIMYECIYNDLYVCTSERRRFEILIPIAKEIESLPCVFNNFDVDEA